MTIRHRRWRPARYLALTAAAIAVIAVLPGGEDGPVAPVEPAATGAQAIIDASLAVAAAEPVDTVTPGAGAGDTLATAAATPQAAAISPDRERSSVLADDAPEARLAAVDVGDSATDSRSTSDPLSASVAAAVDAPPMSASVTEAGQVHVGSSALNVRAGPTSSAGKLFVLRPGQPVTILERDGNWARIATDTGQGGWVYSRYLADGPAAASADHTSTRAVAAVARAPVDAPAAGPPPEADRSVRHARIGAAMPARAAPSRHAAPLFTLPSGSRVEIAETRGRWLRVVTDSGVSGWIRYR